MKKNQLPIFTMWRGKAFPLLLCLLFTLGTKAQNYTWTDMPGLGQTLYGTASFTIGSNIYVTGGWLVSVIQYGGYPVPINHHVYAFNTVTNTWSQKNDFPGTATYGASAFTIGNYGYIVNGWDSTGSGEGPSATWQYDPSTDTWAQKAAFPGAARYTTANFAVNGKAYIACGFSPYVNDVWCYDPLGDSWSQKNNFPGSARQAMVYFVVGNTAYAGMGATGDNMGSYFLESDWYRYNDTTDTWVSLNPFPGDAVDAAYTFVLNGEGYVVGGLDQNAVYYSNNVNASNKVWKYNPSGDAWSLVGLFPDSARFGGGAFGQGNGAGYMGFGASNFSNYPLTDKFYRFGPAIGTPSCAVTVNKYEISNAVYNFQANGNFSPSAQITWNFGDGSTGIGTSVIHNYTAVGSYTATAYVNDSTCSDSSSTSVSVSNINNCTVAVNATGFGTTFTLSTSITQGAGPYTYLWSCTSDSTFSSTSPDPVVTVPVNTPVNYCVTVTDTTGCVATACKAVVDSQTYYTPCQIYLVVYPDSAVPGYYYGIIYTGNNNPVSYLWSFGDGDTSSQMFPSHTYATPGYYVICLTVSDGSCSFTFCDSSFYAFKYGGGPMVHFNVTSEVVVSALGVNNISANTIAIYPNPANSEITINAAGQKIDNATIYDINGQTVIDTKSPSKNNIDVSQLAAGIYFIEVKVNGMSSRVKFVKAN
jgi:N-acetylneuraminic acid mutarotase/PKD repeat protein